MGKFRFMIVLDCHEHSGTRTAVRSAAALLRIDLPAVTFVDSCSSQTVSIYGNSKNVTVCCYSRYVTKTYNSFTLSTQQSDCQ
jgi:hypothetical protein